MVRSISYRGSRLIAPPSSVPVYGDHANDVLTWEDLTFDYTSVETMWTQGGWNAAPEQRANMEIISEGRLPGQKAIRGHYGSPGGATGEGDCPLIEQLQMGGTMSSHWFLSWWFRWGPNGYVLPAANYSGIKFSRLFYQGGTGYLEGFGPNRHAVTGGETYPDWRVGIDTRYLYNDVLNDPSQAPYGYPYADPNATSYAWYGSQPEGDKGQARPWTYADEQWHKVTLEVFGGGPGNSYMRGWIDEDIIRDNFGMGASYKTEGLAFPRFFMNFVQAQGVPTYFFLDKTEFRVWHRPS